MASLSQGLTHDTHPNDAGEVAMRDFPKFEYTMHDVKRAGEALKGDVPWSEDTRDELLAIFKIANNWIDSHGYPMARLRTEAHSKVRKCGGDSLVFARLKRMRSVRRKLATLSAKLDQVQDLGGCRIIAPSIDRANELIACYCETPKHVLHNAKDYIAKPKPGGYRSHHLNFKFQGKNGSEVLNGRRVEVQIRTRLQHAWATAVEAVGTFRFEDMKAGRGDPDWLRLFELMSAEIALAERCPEPPGVPSRSERVKEIRSLNEKIEAVTMLESMRQAVKYTSSYVEGPEPPKYYRIEFNRRTRVVVVKPHIAPKEALFEQHGVEQSAEMEGNSDINTVVVNADSIEALKEGYPNYFGDVQLFNKTLREIVQGKEATEYTLPPLQSVPQRPREAGDLSWLRPGRGRRWE